MCLTQHEYHVLQPTQTTSPRLPLSRNTGYATASEAKGAHLWGGFIDLVIAITIMVDGNTPRDKDRVSLK